MIDDLDRTLRKLLELEFGTPLPFDLSFAIPDKSFTPTSSQRNTLNCYLYDVRENRELRDPEPRWQRLAGGLYELDRPPCRVKVSYCITAWSPAEVTPQLDPHHDEHLLLAQVLRVLLRHPMLPRAALMGTLVNQVPPIPTEIAQPDSARNSGDFWNAIGGQLRPSLEYSATISLDYRPQEQGSIVTSLLTRIGARDGEAEAIAGAADLRFAIGGSVWSSVAANRPVPGAWVRVVETGEVAVADDQGRFVLDRLSGGSYNLAIRAQGFQEGGRPLTVPSVAGSYDVTLDPLP